MKRDILKSLQQWKTSPIRVPAIIRGARQVGKSWVIKEFGKTFENLAEFNFEQNTALHDMFSEDLRVDTLLEKLNLHLTFKITPGKTLLFFDEIQACKRALLALRYFKEQCPDLHVIAAGSLLDFILDDIGMPVGRVQFFYVYPLSFGEFLENTGHENWRQHLIKEYDSTSIHTNLLEQSKLYAWLGGMPEVVKTWIQHKDANLCQSIQERILQAYQQDFLKYAKGKQIHQVDKVFKAVPQQLGNKFKYTAVDPNQNSTTLRQALQLLKKAGVVHIVPHSSGQALPLSGSSNEKQFKVFYFDTGLSQRSLNVDFKVWFKQNLEVQYKGGIAEQLVAQELIAYQNNEKPAELFHWRREAKYSNAEIDFLIAKQDKIIPIEVKSGTKGQMQSMRLFLDSHKNTPYGLKIFSNQFSTNGNINEIPFYAIEAWLKHQD